MSTPHAEQKKETVISTLLLLYLSAVCVGAALIVIYNFPTVTGEGLIFPRLNADDTFTFAPFNWHLTLEQGLIVLALCGGMAGSFLHAGQSLISYIGNGKFRSSWTSWYMLRPWIGGILGFTLYFTLRAGLISGVVGVNPYGTVGLGILGGWFSKAATDKLQKVFETLLNTEQDALRDDKLTGDQRDSDPDPDPDPGKDSDGESETEEAEEEEEKVQAAD